MYGNEWCTSRNAMATDEARGPLQLRGSTYARQKRGASPTEGRMTSIKQLRCAETASYSSRQRDDEEADEQEEDEAQGLGMTSSKRPNPIK